MPDDIIIRIAMPENFEPFDFFGVDAYHNGNKISFYDALWCINDVVTLTTKLPWVFVDTRKKRKYDSIENDNCSYHGDLIDGMLTIKHTNYMNIELLIIRRDDSDINNRKSIFVFTAENKTDAMQNSIVKFKNEIKSIFPESEEIC